MFLLPISKTETRFNIINTTNNLKRKDQGVIHVIDLLFESSKVILFYQ